MSTEADPFADRVCRREAIRLAEIDRQIREYHGLGITNVLDAIAYLRDCDSCVIAGGSLAFGLGNLRSDLDVVVTGAGVVGGSRVPVEHFVGTLRVDVWKRGQDQVEAIFRDAECALASSDPFYDQFGTVDEEADLKLLHRIAFGIQMDGDPMKLSLPRDQRDVACDLVTREYAERMREAAFVAQVAEMSGSVIASMMNARRAVEDVLHMMIAARGLPFTGDKWLHERLAKDADDLCPLYEKFVVLPDREEDWRTYTRGALKVCSELSGLNLAAARLSEGARWVADELRLVELSGVAFLVSRQHGGLWSLDQDEVSNWNVLQKQRSTGHASVGGWACAELDSSMMAFCYRLYEQGLATLRWASGVLLEDIAAIQRAVL